MDDDDDDLSAFYNNAELAPASPRSLGSPPPPPALPARRAAVIRSSAAADAASAATPAAAAAPRAPRAPREHEREHERDAPTALDARDRVFIEQAAYASTAQRYPHAGQQQQKRGTRGSLPALQAFSYDRDDELTDAESVYVATRMRLTGRNSRALSSLHTLANAVKAAPRDVLGLSETVRRAYHDGDLPECTVELRGQLAVLMSLVCDTLQSGPAACRPRIASLVAHENRWVAVLRCAAIADTAERAPNASAARRNQAVRAYRMALDDLRHRITQ